MSFSLRLASVSWLNRLLAVVGLVFLAGCSGGGDATGRVLSVPGDHPTIQAAVDASGEGDIVFIEPGTYREQVTVSTPNITIRGTDRNTVILDGGGELSNGVDVGVSGVSVENLTVKDYLFNGVIFNGADGEYRADGTGSVDGYRAAFVTAYNNGLYGIYAFAAVNGEITDSYASGHPDSGFYIGQCKPCNVVVRNVTAELNAIGYYGTNASGDVYVVESTFTGNRLGIAPNSQDAELLAPQAETVVAGNLVTGAGAEGAPEIRQGLFGGGIAVGGGNLNAVLRNRVVDNVAYGIGLVALGPYNPTGNRVEGNVMERNGVDLVYGPDQTTDSADNCFTDNTFATSSPEDIESAMPCTGSSSGATAPQPFTYPTPPPGPGPRDVPAPSDQPTMPDPTLPRSTPGQPTFPDVDSIDLPPAS